jgi:hypothetical protein
MVVTLKGKKSSAWNFSCQFSPSGERHLIPSPVHDPVLQKRMSCFAIGAMGLVPSGVIFDSDESSLMLKHLLPLIRGCQ